MNVPHLRELTLANFKSFAEPQTVPFAPVTVFVGANGSGKSNVFDALRILQGLGKGLTVAEVLGGSRTRGVHPGIRGGAAEVCFGDRDAFRIEVAASISGSDEGGAEASDENVRWRHGMLVQPHDFPIVAQELLIDPRVSMPALSATLISLPDRQAPFLQFVPTPDGPRSDRSLVVAYPRIVGAESSLIPVTEGFSALYRALTFHELQPQAMRQYDSLEQTELREDGGNLSAVLHRLLHADDEAKRRFVDWMGEVCAPHVADVEFVRTELNDVLVQLVESNGVARRISARSLSDGTLRFMGLLAAFLSAPPGTTFLLEEVENGLHPTRIHLLCELMEQTAAERGICIVATTHSPQVLLGLSEAALRDAVLFARSTEHPGTVVRRLGDLPDFEQVVRATHIDELFSTGWLEFAS